MRLIQILHFFILFFAKFEVMGQSRCGSRIKLLRFEILHIDCGGHIWRIGLLLFKFLCFLYDIKIIADILFHLLSHAQSRFYFIILLVVRWEHSFTWWCTEPNITCFLHFILDWLALLFHFLEVRFNFPLPILVQTLIIQLGLRLEVLLARASVSTLTIKQIKVTFRSWISWQVTLVLTFFHFAVITLIFGSLDFTFIRQEPCSNITNHIFKANWVRIISCFAHLDHIRKSSSFGWFVKRILSRFSTLL